MWNAIQTSKVNSKPQHFGGLLSGKYWYETD
jgi:hypothetical protein